MDALKMFLQNVGAQKTVLVTDPSAWIMDNALACIFILICIILVISTMILAWRSEKTVIKLVVEANIQNDDLKKDNAELEESKTELEGMLQEILSEVSIHKLQIDELLSKESAVFRVAEHIARKSSNAILSKLGKNDICLIQEKKLIFETDLAELIKELNLTFNNKSFRIAVLTNSDETATECEIPYLAVDLSLEGDFDWEAGDIMKIQIKNTEEVIFLPE